MVSITNTKGYLRQNEGIVSYERDGAEQYKIITSAITSPGET